MTAKLISLLEAYLIASGCVGMAFFVWYFVDDDVPFKGWWQRPAGAVFAFIVAAVIWPGLLFPAVRRRMTR